MALEQASPDFPLHPPTPIRLLPSAARSADPLPRGFVGDVCFRVELRGCQQKLQ